jgi:hypothetical protein
MEITTTSRSLQRAKGNNDYGLVVVREKEDTIMVIKNRLAVGTYMASDRGLFRQLASQEKETAGTFEEGLKMAEQWLSTIEEEISAKLSEVADSLHSQALAQNYKPGWAFYRMKDFYRYELATKFAKSS